MWWWKKYQNRRIHCFPKVINFCLTHMLKSISHYHGKYNEYNEYNEYNAYMWHIQRYKERKQLMLATAEAERRMRNAGIFIKSWIYSRNFTKSWMWNVAEICCHLHQKLNLSKKVKCSRKAETLNWSKNLTDNVGWFSHLHQKLNLFKKVKC